MIGSINGEKFELSTEQEEALLKNIVLLPITTDERLSVLEQAFTELAIQTMGVNIDE